MIVRESLNFERTGNPLEKMNIGIKARLKDLSLEELSPMEDPDAREIKKFLCQFFETSADNIFLLADIGDAKLSLVKKIAKYIHENKMISGVEVTDEIEINFYKTSIGNMASEHSTWEAELIWGDINSAIALNIGMNESLNFERGLNLTNF